MTRSASIDTPVLAKVRSESTLYSSCLSLEYERRLSQPVEMVGPSSELVQPLSVSAPERSSPIAIQVCFKITCFVNFFFCQYKRDVSYSYNNTLPLYLMVEFLLKTFFRNCYSDRQPVLMKWTSLLHTLPPHTLTPHTSPPSLLSKAMTSLIATIRPRLKNPWKRRLMIIPKFQKWNFPIKLKLKPLTI